MFYIKIPEVVNPASVNLTNFFMIFQKYHHHHRPRLMAHLGPAGYLAFDPTFFALGSALSHETNLAPSNVTNHHECMK